ncbi:PilZ domain-containing protein [Paenibacillus roseipurpureus]|uniref:PilZ domain-containing protein n=1 Tax=Paenibacillus roseopurpureus TaxID=2918901 RepID=A0AA96RLM4_9BACL|nr:PilZ domain-containing protein [Paenibacillus sp. MBLB1832]WNR45576.1 PilZ domain-containing protein [Paenibacillus sp. MBLB1832]
MDWNKVLELASISPNQECHIIIVGECKDGQPFCFEDHFTIDKISENSITVYQEQLGLFPFDKLSHVSFIEFSFRDGPVLYYGYVDLVQLELKKTICYLTLSLPEETFLYQNRRNVRAKLAQRTPVTIRVAGIRGISAQKSVAFTGQLLDISAGGLSFVTTNRLFIPLFLEFSFILPTFDQPVTLFGEIIRVTHFSNDSYRIAVEFRHTPDAIMQEIDSYCSSY